MSLAQVLQNPPADNSHPNSVGYTVISPPDDLALYDASLTWREARIDYRVHPAYREFVARARLVDRLAALGIFAKSMLLLTVKRVIQYELIPLDTRSGAGLGGRLNFAAAAVKSMFRRGKVARVSEAHSETATQLDETGIAVVGIPSERFFELEHLAEPYFADLRRRRGNAKAGDRDFDESRSSVSRRSGGALFECIESILDESGLIAASSTHKGRRCRLVDVNPQINDKSDGFWRNIFPDLKLSALPSLAYSHRDASGGDVKAIIYMSDVGPENGPFIYARGTHKLAVNRIDDLIGEANDSNGLSGTGPVARRRFAALPAKLRQKCSYGNDLPDDTPLSKALLPCMWEITAPKGAIVMFDTKGTHCGGMVEEGERRVITCVIG